VEGLHVFVGISPVRAGENEKAPVISRAVDQRQPDGCEIVGFKTKLGGPLLPGNVGSVAAQFYPEFEGESHDVVAYTVLDHI